MGQRYIQKGWWVGKDSCFCVLKVAETFRIDIQEDTFNGLIQRMLEY